MTTAVRSAVSAMVQQQQQLNQHWHTSRGWLTLDCI